MTDKYIYGLKATSHSAFKPLSLSNKMRLSKTSGLRNSRFTFTLTNIVKIDPELKDLNCELISFSGNDKVLASGKLDNKGKCVIAWTPEIKLQRVNSVATFASSIQKEVTSTQLQESI